MRDRLVERVLFAQIARNLEAVSRARVGVGERPAASAGKRRQTRCVDADEVDRALAIPQLADVVVLGPAALIGEAAPTQQHIACCLHRALPLDDALAMLRAGALAAEALEHRFLGFLDLQDQGVVAVSALHHHDERTRPHAPDTHDLMGDVDAPVELDEAALVRRERALVFGECEFHELLHVDALEELRLALALRDVAQGDDDGRVADDAQFAVDHFRELGDGAGAVLRLRLGDRLARFLQVALRCLSGKRGEQRIDVGVRIPHVEVPHPCERRHRFAVAARTRENRRLAVLFLHVVVAAADLDARGEALHVPFPWSARRFVEVVDVEDRAAFRRREEPEVGDVRIAACLHLDVGCRGACEVRRHDEGTAPVERERRNRHALVAEGEQLLRARDSLALQELDGVIPVGGGSPCCMCLVWDFLAKLASVLVALFGRALVCGGYDAFRVRMYQRGERRDPFLCHGAFLSCPNAS